MTLQTSRIPNRTLGRFFGPEWAPVAAAVGALIWSTGSVISRFADSMDAWQYLFWRSIGVLAVIELLAFRAGKPRQVLVAFRGGKSMLAATLGLFSASLGYVYAIKNTTAANASLFASLSPVIASILAWAVLRERLKWQIVVASLIALGGLLVMAFAPSAVDAVGIAPTLKGNIGGLISSVGFAGYAVALRTDRKRDWSPSMPGYSVIMIAVCGGVTLLGGKSLVPRLDNIALALLHGAIVIVVGTFVFNWASKSVGAVAIVLLAQVEMVIVPLLIFFVFGERPTAVGIVGALLILGSVVFAASASQAVDGRPVADALTVADSKPVSSVRPGK